jgi:hypothetical protein
MRIPSVTRIGLSAFLTAAATVAGCSSSNNPSTTAPNTTGGSTSSTGTTAASSSSPGTTATSSSSASSATGAGGGDASTSTTSSSSSGTSTGSSSSGATVGADAGGGGGDAGTPATCPSTLKDKVTTCTVGTDPDCLKGCGPDLPAGSSQTNLGTKTCTCMTGVYQCGACDYEAPLPLCYQESATPAACDVSVADKLPCTTPCTTGTGNDVCTATSDAGKAEGCVCITGSKGNVWTCATTPWM